MSRAYAPLSIGVQTIKMMSVVMHMLSQQKIKPLLLIQMMPENVQNLVVKLHVFASSLWFLLSFEHFVMSFYGLFNGYSTGTHWI